MTHHNSYVTKSFFLAACLTLGCTGGGALGCGSSSGGPDPATVDSDLPGVYKITSYRASKTSCDNPPEESLPPQRLVIYPFHPSTEGCRDIAELGANPSLGYSFQTGSDQAGWTGHAILEMHDVGENCEARVQTHNLTLPNGGLSPIHIESPTVETSFKAELGGPSGAEAICRNSAAIASVDDQDPCVEIILLDATREADLTP